MFNQSAYLSQLLLRAAAAWYRAQFLAFYILTLYTR